MSFHSFKNELLIYTLGLTFATIILTTVIGVFSTKTAGDEAADATSAVLRIQAEKFLVQVASAAAQQQDLLFEQVRNETKKIAFYTAEVYKNPLVFSGNGYWDFDTRVIRKEGRYVNDVSDVSTFHIPSFVTLDKNEKRNIELTAALDFVVPSILDNSKNSVAIYTIDTKGVTRYFPNIVLGELGPPDYDPRADIYYLPATPKNNPEREVVWSPLYDDVAGRGLMITATAPVYTKDGFAGIAATDVLLKSIIESITAYSPVEGSYAFLIDREGNTVAFPDRAYEDIVGRSRALGEGRINLSDYASSKDFLPALKDMKSGTTGFSVFSNGEGKHLFMAYAPLKQTGFSMGVVADEDVILKMVGTLRSDISDSIRSTIAKLIFPASLFIILVALIVGIFIANQVVKPVQKLTAGVREIGKGNLDYKIKVQSRNEIGELASSFGQMSSALKKSRQKLYEYSQGLEEQVKERTKELTAANSRLRQLDQMKSEFVSIASHQLRTPLTATKGYISMLLEGSYGDLSKDVRVALNKVYASNERLVRIVNDLLDISRIESGKFQYTFAKISLPDLLENVVKEFTIAAEIQKLRILWEMPANPERFVVSADEEKLRQTFLNLLDNAIKYTPKGHIEVKIVQDVRPGYIRVSIKDTGIGISGEERGELFERFVRGKGGAHVNASGSGIGLYIAKKIVDDHHGRIWAESEGPGKGSTFIVTLPIYRQVPAQT
ncbi:MAG: sensor histidine kinase [Candidatus Spechtbacteria bacterium]|nr:sensor histidine kinase [Candidatus Spechtbacteria bacterium]